VLRGVCGTLFIFHPDMGMIKHENQAFYYFRNWCIINRQASAPLIHDETFAHFSRQLFTVLYTVIKGISN